MLLTKPKYCCETHLSFAGDYWKKSILEWTNSKNLKHMPKMTVREIESFFEKSGKTGKTKKRADNIIFDSFLDNIEFLNTANFFYIRSICSASYSKGKFHKLSCAFQNHTAAILHAYCTCVAGKGGFCNHIYALLKMLAQFVLDDLSEIPGKLPCTSRPCGWTVPQVRKLNIQKQTIMETTVKKPKVDKITKGVGCTLYEARASHVRLYDSGATTSLQKQWKDSHSRIPMLFGLRKSIKTTDWADSKFGKVPIFSPLAYQCSKLGNNFQVYLNMNVNLERVAILTPCAGYPDFPLRCIPQYFKYDYYTLPLSEQSILRQLNVTDKEATAIEQATIGQSNSALWHEERKRRLTASKVHEVYKWKRGFDHHAEKFVAPLSDHNMFVQKKLMHGSMYEPVAWEKYKLCLENVQVFSSGLVINANNYWLGCSPDTKLINGDFFGIGESKCPELYKNCDLLDVAKSSQTFMLYVSEENKLEVRKTHSTYYQIQCQLALTGAQFCDLVVYTFQSLAVVRVKYDEQFWLSVVNKVGEVYFKYILSKLK